MYRRISSSGSFSCKMMNSLYVSRSHIRSTIFILDSAFQVSTSRGIGLIIGPAIGGYFAQVEMFNYCTQKKSILPSNHTSIDSHLALACRCISKYLCQELHFWQVDCCIFFNQQSCHALFFPFMCCSFYVHKYADSPTSYHAS